MNRVLDAVSESEKQRYGFQWARVALWQAAGKLSSRRVKRWGAGLALTLIVFCAAMAWADTDDGFVVIEAADGSGQTVSVTNYNTVAPGSVGGTGTTNKVAKWTAATILGDSVITDDGSTVIIVNPLGLTTVPPAGIELYVDHTGINLDSTIRIDTSQGATKDSVLQLFEAGFTEGELRWDASESELVLKASGSGSSTRIDIGDGSGDVVFASSAIAGQGLVHIARSTTGFTVDSDYDEFIVENNLATGMTFAGGQSSNVGIAFADLDDAKAGEFVFDHATNQFSTKIGGTEILGLKSGFGFFPNSQGLVIGHDAQIDFGATPEFQILGTSTPDSSMGFARFQNNASGPDLRFLKSRGVTIGTNVLPFDGDTIGRIRFQIADGIDFNTPAAQIHAEVDGAPGNNDAPGRLIFSTTPDGASSVVEGMRLTQNGRLGLGTTSPENLLGVAHGARAVNVTNDNGSAAFVVEGSAAAALLIANSGAGLNLKAAGLVNADGKTIFRSLNDADLAPNVDNILVMDHASGHVGINDPSPVALFTIKSDIDDATGGFRIEDKDTSNFPVWIYGAVDEGRIQLDNVGVAKVLIRANGDSYLTGGDFGIGTAAPTRDLHISSTVPTIRLSDSNAGTDQTVATLIELYRGDSTNRVGFWGMESSSNNVMKMATDYTAGEIRLATGNNVTALTIDSSQNVGINDPSPPALLSVKSNSDSTLGGIKLIDKDTVNVPVTIWQVANEGRIRLDHIGISRIDLRSNGNSFFTGGNVGFGTVTPTEKLDVNDGNIAITSGAVSTDYTIFNVLAGHNLATGDGSFRVGVTESTAFRAGMRADQIWNGATSDYELSFQTTEGGVASVERMRIDNVGNVGVGTATPENLLGVAHGVRAVNVFNDNGGAALIAEGSQVAILLMADASAGLNLKAAGFVNASGKTIFRSFNDADFTLNVDNILVLDHATGRIGMGTATPGSLFEMSDAGTIRLTVRNETEAVNQLANLDFLTGTGVLAGSNSIGTISAKITQATPSTLKSEMRFFINKGDATVESLTLEDNGDVTMAVTQGNVGIGTASPARRLDLAIGHAYIRTPNTTTTMAHEIEGLELGTGKVGAIDSYYAVLKFVSRDTDFTTTNPKMTGYIAGRSTQLQTLDTHGGMAMDFAVFPNTGGTSALPAVAFSIDQDRQSIFTVNRAGYTAHFENDGNAQGRYGIEVQGGQDDAGGVTLYFNALDGDGGQVGYLENNAGTFRLIDGSDRRLKTDIRPTQRSGLDIVNAIPLHEFRFLDGDNPTTGTFIGKLHEMDFIAQDIAAVFPDAISKFSPSKRGGADDPILGVARSQLLPVNWKATQELSALVDTQSLELAVLKNQMAALLAEHPEIRVGFLGTTVSRETSPARSTLAQIAKAPIMTALDALDRCRTPRIHSVRMNLAPDPLPVDERWFVQNN